MSDSDSDDDVPLGKVVNNNKKRARESTNTNNVKKEIQSPSTKNSTTATKKKEDDENEDEDSDDDMPLSLMKKKTTPEKKKLKTTTPIKKEKEKEKTPIKSSPIGNKNKKNPIKSNNNSNGNSNLKKKPVVDSGSGVSYDFYQTKKGELVQSLLCRWWYAYQWPDPSDILDTPPLHYESLDGFQGVYVCVEGQKIGHIIDNRNMDTCPCFKNFAKKKSSELKEMLITALKAQQKELEQHEPDNKKLYQIVLDKPIPYVGTTKNAETGMTTHGKVQLFKFEISENADGTAATSYNYVSQCSNRGMCNSDTATCECFKGYAKDSCDTQNAFAL